MISEWIIEPCDKENIGKIVEGINEYNLSKVSAVSNVWTPLEYVMKNKNGIEIAGLLSGIN